MSLAIMNVMMSVSCFSFSVPAKYLNKYEIIILLTDLSKLNVRRKSTFLAKADLMLPVAGIVGARATGLLGAVATGLVDAAAIGPTVSGATPSAGSSRFMTGPESFPETGPKKVFLGHGTISCY